MAGKVHRLVASVNDTLQNLVSRLGTASDKSTYNSFVFTPLDRGQLEAAYRGDWVARKVVNIPAQDATREWRDWKAEESQIELLEATERRLNLRGKVRMAMIKARLYGGGGLILGFGDGKHAEELRPETVRKDGLKFVHAFAKHEVTCGEPDGNVDSANYGLPSYYTLNSVNARVGGNMIQVHPSRVVRLCGAEVPDRTLTGDGWADSVLDALIDAVKNVAASTSGISTLIQESKIDVVKIPGFMEGMQSQDYKNKVIERFALVNQAKSLVSTMLLDKEEDWERINASFAGMPELMKLYLLVASGAADIPATRMLSQSAQGLNATGEGDMRNYYDHVRSVQTNELSPALETLDEVVIRSALGARPEDVWYEWRPLWQMTPKERADVAKAKADTVKVLVDTGLVEADVLAVGVKNMLIDDGTLPGMEQAYDDFEDAGEGVDEEDPQVREQFNKLKVGSSSVAPSGPTRGQAGGGDSSGRPRLRVVSGDEDLLGAARRVVKDAMQRAMDEFSEEKIERDKDGKFSSGGGGDGKEETVTVFHGTTSKVIDKIAKQGLRITGTKKDLGRSVNDHTKKYKDTRGRSVYVSTKEITARDYAELKHWVSGGNAAVFRIEVPKSEWARFKKDEFEDKSSKAFRSEKSIPKEWIKDVRVFSSTGKSKVRKLRDSLSMDSEDDVVEIWVVIDLDEFAEVADAAPRTLYVRRDLLNGEEVLKHFQSQVEGAELMPASSLHVTVAYSRQPVDWAKMPDEWYGGVDEDGNLRVRPGGMRMMERLGAEDPRAAVVMQFSSTSLTIRWRDLCESGASWDFPDFQPHVTIAWDKDQKIDASALKPWTGELLFGPEIFEEIDEDWKAKAGVDE